MSSSSGSTKSETTLDGRQEGSKKSSIEYDELVLAEGGYTLEFSNRGGKVHENPCPLNYKARSVKCAVQECPRFTTSVLSLCPEHTKNKKKNLPPHTTDWIGRLIPPGLTRDECLTDAPAHFTIAEMLIKWMGRDPDRRRRMDGFIADLLDGKPEVRIAESVPDATTLQRNLETDPRGPEAPHAVVMKVIAGLDKHFPAGEFSTILLEGPNYRGRPLKAIPIRTAAAMLALAYSAEEANRGDAWYYKKHEVPGKPKRASAYMPSVYYFLRRHTNASEDQARMSLKG